MITHKKLTLAVQKSGRLADATFEFLRECGFSFRSPSRALKVSCTNFPLELLFFRSKDIPQAVAQGVADMGICGQDVMLESGHTNLTEVVVLGMGSCRMSIAAKGPLELDGAKIATSFPRILTEYLATKGQTATVVPLSGSVEIAPGLGMADAICDLVSSGSTLAQNGLVELEEVMKSEAVLMATADLLETEILSDFMLRVHSTLTAKQTKYIIMNAPETAIEVITHLLPGLKNPTISPLSNEGWVSIATVVETRQFWETIKRLKQTGAEGILVLPIEQLIA